MHAAEEGDLAVIGVFMEAGDADPTIQSLWEAIPGPDESPAAVDALDPGTLLPGGRGYFRYQGSLTTPPCSEVVSWVVTTESISVSQAQVDVDIGDRWPPRGAGRGYAAPLSAMSWPIFAPWPDRPHDERDPRVCLWVVAGSPCEALCQFKIRLSIGIGQHRGTDTPMIDRDLAPLLRRAVATRPVVTRTGPRQREATILKSRANGRVFSRRGGGRTSPSRSRPASP